MAGPIRIDVEREEAELRAYLADRYDHSRLIDYDRQLEEEYARIGDEAELYRTSEGYLYNLTAFAMTRTKEPYLADLTAIVEPPAHLLDYGCGIGSDGLVLIEAGYRVSFADFDNPSTRYLRWRLEHRGLSADVYDLDSDELPGGFDAAYAFDVIEHVDGPFDLLARMEAQARLVMVNLLEPEPGETTLHRELPVGELVRRAAGMRLRRYRVHHGRSHVVAYEPQPAAGWALMRSRLELLRGRVGI